MITREEYELLKQYRTKGYRWIARDEDECVYVYKSKPIKLGSSWENNELGCSGWSLNDDSLPNIEWGDEKPTKIDDLTKEYEQHEMLKRKAVIPQYVADFINKAKPIMGFYSAMYNLFHFGSISMETPSKDGAVRDWVEKNEETFARAWLDGFEVEKEQLYTVRLKNGYHLCKYAGTGVRWLNMTEFNTVGCYKLTQAEIESVDPILMQIAKPVEVE